jgi:hypothetical protein
MGKARSRGGSIGVRGVKYAEEDVVLFVDVDSDVSNGGGLLWPVRWACWTEPVRFSLFDGDSV